MVCLSAIQENRNRSDMAVKKTSLVVNTSVLETELAKVFYKSSVKEIMAIVKSVHLVEPEKKPLIVVKMSKADKAFFNRSKNTNEHVWELQDPRSTGLKIYGGRGTYVCNVCNATLACSRAELPHCGCIDSK